MSGWSCAFDGRDHDAPPRKRWTEPFERQEDHRDLIWSKWSGELITEAIFLLQQSPELVALVDEPGGARKLNHLATLIRNDVPRLSTAVANFVSMLGPGSSFQVDRPYDD